MSDPKTISPLLDGFTLGPPMSEHDGVRCCPAIKENSDKKYIVKILSIPASQTQMDALLLAGAYRDPADAMEYFRQLGEDVMKEAELLKTLSSAGGFLSYEGWQMEPITKSRLGYEVYLVSSYKRSLEKYVRGNPVTHLEAMNLGLDLCEALSVCRQAGALYVDLKPPNVFLSAKKEYRIADLGFVSLDALSYMSQYPDNSEQSLRLLKSLLWDYLKTPGNTLPPRHLWRDLLRLYITPVRRLRKACEEAKAPVDTGDYYP